MTENWLSRLRRTAAECLLGAIVLVLLACVCFQFDLGSATTGIVLLMALVLLSLRGGFASAIILSAVALGLLALFFARPIVFDFNAAVKRNLVLTTAFPVTTLLVTWLMDRVRRQTAALRTSEQHWKHVFEQNPTIYFLVDAHGTVLSVNGPGASQLGYAVSEIVGQPVLSLCIDADREFMENNLALCAAAPGQSRSWEARKQRKDGTVLWTHENAKFVQWDADEPVFLISSEDITQARKERKEAEAAIRRSQAHLHEAQKLGRIGSWSLDVSAGLIFASPELMRIFGLDPEKVELTQDFFQQIVHPDDRALIEGIIEERKDTQADYEYEFRIVLPDGTIRQLHSVSRPVLDDSGAPVDYVGETMDVTEHRQAEEALRQAYADLARASRITIIGELTASLAHEVNQPITAAVTNANACVRWLSAATPNVEEARAAAVEIVNDGTRAAEIISRTRRLFERGDPERTLVEIDDVIRETVLLMGSEASRTSVSIRTFLAAGAPEIMADRLQLQQVLMNLILNGIEAMKEMGGVREMVIRSQISGEEEIMVSVSDNGPGLPAGLADRLFETFFTTKPRGTGMGLSISRSILSAHGGRLWAEANEPRGALFKFTLPTAPRPPEA